MALATLPPQTTSQAFQQAGLPAWWAHPTQRFGQGGSGYGTEEGTDFALPLGTKVGSISSGKVVYVGTGGYNDPSLGTIVQVQSPDGSLWHYQHLKSSGLKVGQSVQVGSLIGLSGGQAGKYSSGPHIEVRHANIYNFSGGVWSQQWVDSYPYISSATRAKPNNVGANPTNVTTGIGNQATSTLLSSNTVVGPSFTLPTVSIGPSADITAVLQGIDQLMVLIPPWQVIQTHDVFIAGIDTGLVDPISWVEGVLFNIGADSIAIMIRAILLIWGIGLGLKVLSSFVDFKAVGTTVAEGVRTGLTFAALGV